MTEEKNGATGKLTIRQWKATKLEIQDDEAKRITKKILHDEYLKPYPFDVPKGYVEYGIYYTRHIRELKG